MNQTAEAVLPIGMTVACALRVSGWRKRQRTAGSEYVVFVMARKP